MKLEKKKNIIEKLKKKKKKIMNSAKIIYILQNKNKNIEKIKKLINILATHYFTKQYVTWRQICLTLKKKKRWSSCFWRSIDWKEEEEGGGGGRGAGGGGEGRM